jgi:peptide/nickel transport system permease protein
MTGLTHARGALRFAAGSTDFLRNLAHHVPALVGLVLLLVLAAIALITPALPLPDPATFGGHVLVPPGSDGTLLGTDHLGRDLFSRVLWGARTALLVAVVSAGIAVVVGVVLGSIAGYFGGIVDDVLSRIFDVFLLLPAFFLLILVVALFGQSLVLITVVIGLTTWPSSARIMRSQALSYRNRVFVEAGRAAGAGPMYLLARHVIPNGIAPVITNSTILMGQAILTEAGLSFLGLGDPNVVSWGRMIFDGRTYLDGGAWVSIVPGLAVLVTVVALNLLGDGISYAFAPQAHRDPLVEELAP